MLQDTSLDMTLQWVWWFCVSTSVSLISDSVSWHLVVSRPMWVCISVHLGPGNRDMHRWLNSQFGKHSEHHRVAQGVPNSKKASLGQVHRFWHVLSKVHEPKGGSALVLIVIGGARAGAWAWTQAQPSVATSYTFARVMLVSVCRQVLDSLWNLYISVFQCMRAQGKHLMYLEKFFF